MLRHHIECQNQDMNRGKPKDTHHREIREQQLCVR